MTSKDYKRVLITDRHELTDADFENTLMHFAKLYHEEQPDVVGQSKQLSLCQCDKPSPDIMYGETCTECCLQIDTKA